MALPLVLGACRCNEREVRVIHPFPAHYAGVGLELRMRDGWPVVVRVLPGGPAEAAELREGDVLLAIDSVPTDGWELADVVAALRGDAGTRVLLTVRRALGSPELVVLRRGEIARPDGGLDGRGYRGVRR